MRDESRQTLMLWARSAFRRYAGLLTVLLVAVVFTAACVSPPARKPPPDGITVPEEWSAREEIKTEGREAASTEAEPMADWWTTFKDPRLDELVQSALAENYDLTAAAYRVEQAEAAARIAGADLKPFVNANLDWARGRQNFIGFPIPGGSGQVLSTTTTRYGLSLDVGWEVDLWGRIRAGARAAVADWQATEAELGGARLSVAAQTAKTWFAVIEASQQLELARNTAASRQTTARQVRSRFQRGLRPAVELRLALSNQANAEAVAEQARRFLDITVRQLEILLGRYPGRELVDVETLGELPTTLPPVPVGLPADLIARRPDLQAAERRLAAADQRYLQARRSLYPRLSLTASGGAASIELGDLLDGDFGVWNLIANLAQPLFQGGRLRAGVAAAGAGADASLALYAAIALDAYAEVESSLAAESYLAGQERNLANSAQQLTAALELAENRYNTGVGDYLTVLESQTREFTARIALLDVRRERLDNRVNLHVALGGGFGSVSTDKVEQQPDPAP